MNNVIQTIKLIVLFIFIAIFLVFGLLIIHAEYNLWSSSIYAQSEIERAKGEAEANRIIGDSLRENEAYLVYHWIDSLKKANNQIIYIPTEANLPILQASGSNHNNRYPWK